MLNLFYEHWLGTRGTTKAAALAWAQLRLRDNPRYHHPFHWAAFELFGDWV
jgi:CHAT domain-containing protein